MMSRQSMIVALLTAFSVFSSGAEPAAPAPAASSAVKPAVENWPDRDWLLAGLVNSVPAILKSFDPATGEFGTKPWISTDQNVLFPLAVAWAAQSPKNPYYHDPKLLEVIGKGGEKLVDAQDAKGMWVFRKKDNSTWGDIHMPWVYSRWIRAYLLVKDALPAEQRAKWEKGLKLGYSRIADYCKGKNYHNINTYHAMGLYAAGVAFDNPEWCDIASRFMAGVIGKQSEDGFWSENHGPVVGYNFVYLDALGIYYAMSKDPAALNALRRGAQFHSALLWTDGSSVSAVDERNPYHKAKRPGNVGFSWTPEGRWYLANYFAGEDGKRPAIYPDTAATMLLEGGTGEIAAPASAGEQGYYLSQDGKFAVIRHRPWQWCFSAYACPAPNNRWIMDRQDAVEIFHDGFGVLAGGGNSKMQPYFSTFTFGNPASFQPDYSTDKPNFAGPADLRYVPDAATIDGNTISLRYGENRASVTVTPQEGGKLAITCRLDAKPDAEAAANMPLLFNAGDKLLLGSGKTVELTKTPVTISGREAAGSFSCRGVRIEFPENATLRYPVTGFNPYHKLGQGATPRLVLTLPLSESQMASTVFITTASSKP
ncbi:MAG: hypothetical protein AB7F32_02050 [Victivallaceae bacterium]